MILQTNDMKMMVQAIRQRLKPKTLIGLSGSMGAGKTTFVSGLLQNQSAAVASPTYALYHSYEALGLTIYHVDLFRLESPEEIDSAGYWDLFAESNVAILTEWIERLNPEELPLDWTKYFLKIEVEANGNRLYSLY